MSKKNKRSQQELVQATTPAGLHISPAFGPNGYTSIFSAPVALTIDEVRQRYSPPLTLGTPEDVRVACDSQLEDCGVYSLLQHSFALGQMPQAQFLGYGILQQIAQNGLVRACIETTADDMTRNWIELKREGEKKDPEKGRGGELQEAKSEEEQEEDETIPQLTAECEKLKLRRILHDAACYVGYMGGCLIFIDTGETAPDVLRSPLNISGMSAELKTDRPLRFVVIDPINIFPGLYNSINPLRQDYFVPRTWWVMGQEIHASRLIRLVANEVPTLLKPSYNFLGIAQAQLLWDYVMHFQECRIASQRLLSKFSLTVFKTDMANILFQAGGTEELDKRIALLVRSRSNDGVEAIDKEEEILKLETPIGGVTDIVRQALEILAAINRTPAVKLLGISPAGFNATGESDIRNYYDHILSQQEKVLRPAITRILDLIQIRLYGKVDKSLTFDFAPLSEEDQAAEAATQKTKVDTMAVLLSNNIVSPEECRKRLADDPNSGFADIDADELPESPEEEGGGGDNPLAALMGGGGTSAGEDPQKAVPKNPNEAPLAGAMEKSAQDAALKDEVQWTTLENGTHVPIKNGETKGEAVKNFVKEKSKEKNATSPGEYIDRFLSVLSKKKGQKISQEEDAYSLSVNGQTLPISKGTLEQMLVWSTDKSDAEIRKTKEEQDGWVDYYKKQGNDIGALQAEISSSFFGDILEDRKNNPSVHNSLKEQAEAKTKAKESAPPDPNDPKFYVPLEKAGAVVFEELEPERFIRKTKIPPQKKIQSWGSQDDEIISKTLKNRESMSEEDKQSFQAYFNNQLNKALSMKWYIPHDELKSLLIKREIYNGGDPESIKERAKNEFEKVMKQQEKYRFGTPAISVRDIVSSASAHIENDAESNAIRYYTGEQHPASFKEINGPLRKGGTCTKEAAESIELLDNVFQRSRTTRPFTVYRGVSAEEITKKLENGEIKVGSTLTDKGFASTSMDPDIAKGFGGTVFVVRVPPDSRAISIGNMSLEKDENEILINRNSRYKVTGIKPGNYQTTVYVDLVRS